MITAKDIEKLASLSRLKLTEEEKTRFQKEIGSILDYVDQLKKAGGKETGPVMSANKNVMREDVVTNDPGAFTEALLALLPKREGRFAKVKKIL